MMCVNKKDILSVFVVIPQLDYYQFDYNQIFDNGKF